MQKLTKQQVKQALEQVPMEYIITGSNSSTLTKKQREFARQMVLQPTKAAAYRAAYNSKGKPSGTHAAAAKLCKDSRIALEIEAFRLAAEAEKHRTPVQIRSLVTDQLIQHAINEDVPHATRIRALELLGKLTEVASFTERRETVVHHSSTDIRARLIEQLRSVNVIDQDDGTDLLDEIASAREPHPSPTPLDGLVAQGLDTHTIPHNQSHEFSEQEFEGPNPENEVMVDDMEILPQEDTPL